MNAKPSLQVVAGLESNIEITCSNGMGRLRDVNDLPGMIGEIEPLSRQIGKAVACA